MVWRGRSFGMGPDSPRSQASITEVAQEFGNAQPRQVHEEESVRRPVPRITPTEAGSSPQGRQVGEGVGGDGGIQKVPLSIVGKWS